MTIIIISIIVFLLALAGLISATETAITATSPGRIQQLVSEGNKKAKILKRILKIKEKVISTLLIGNSISNTLCTTLATSVFIEVFGDDTGTLLSSIVMSFIIIVFSEVVPKAMAVAKPEKLALFAAPGLVLFMRLLAPVNKMLLFIVKFAFKIFKIDHKQDFSGADEVRGVIEHQLSEGNVVKDDRDMLGGILDIRNLIVGDIMIHRSKINSINVDQPQNEIIKFALSCGHTRIPVWQNDPDNIIGILHIRELLKSLEQLKGNAATLNIQSMLTPPWFVSNHSLVTQQLQAFRERQSHLACVVDEYGELQGIITLEDILEEIVGQIYDEHDIGRNKIVRISSKEYTIDGTVTVRDVNRELNWNIPDSGATTIAGFLINEMQRIPGKGESIIVDNLKIIVKTKSSNRIKTVKVYVQKDKEEKDQEKK